VEAGEAWEETALTALTAALQLTPDQQAAVRPELAVAANQIHQARTTALHAYHTALIDLIDRIAPRLDEHQKNLLDKDRKNLQYSILRKLERARGPAAAASPPP
jgi:hypothetical protein